MGKILSFIYEGMADYEVMFVLNRLMKLGGKEIVPISYDKEIIKSKTGYLYKAAATIEEAMEYKDVEGIIITGGPIQPQKPILTKLIQKLHDEGKLVAALCFGPQFLGRAGILDKHKYTTSCTEDKIKKFGVEDPFPRQNYVETRVIVDKNVITAKGYAFLDFTGEVLDYMGIFKTKEEKEQFLNEAKGI